MARGRSFFGQVSVLFVVMVACSFGYLLTMLYWGMEYESTFGELSRLSQSVRLWTNDRRSAIRSRETKRSEPIEWRLFGKEFMSDSELEAIRHVQEEDARKKQQKFLLRFIRQSPATAQRNRTAGHNSAKSRLQSVSPGFQHKLESSWPLLCHSGLEGLFPVNYERLAKVLEDYASFHDKTSPALINNRTNEARVLIWQCSTLDYCGGLTDRMKGITYSLLLAIFSRRRLIINWDDTFLEPNLIDWTDDLVYEILKNVTNESTNRFGKFNSSLEHKSDSNSNEYQDKSDYQAEQVHKQKLDQPAEQDDQPDYFDYIDEYSFADSVRGEIYSKLSSLSEYPYEFRMFSIIDGTGIDNSEDDIIYTLSTIGGTAKYVFLNTNLEPSTLSDAYKSGGQKWIRDGLKWAGLEHLSPEDIDNVLGMAMRYLFRLKDELLREVERAGRTLALSNQLYTSLHIRTGFAGSMHAQENVQMPKLVRDKQSWTDMLKCAVKTANSLLGTSSPILLATDSKIVKHMAVTQYGSRFRTLDNMLLHIDKMDKIPHPLQESEVEGLTSTWVDMLLLAESHVQVGGTSGFIWAASLFCYLPNERRISADTCASDSQYRNSLSPV